MVTVEIVVTKMPLALNFVVVLGCATGKYMIVIVVIEIVAATITEALLFVK